MNNELHRKGELSRKYKTDCRSNISLIFSLFFRSQNKEVQAQSSVNRKSQNGSKSTKVELMLSAGNIDRALNWASFAIIYVKTGSVYKL